MRKRSWFAAPEFNDDFVRSAAGNFARASDFKEEGPRNDRREQEDEAKEKLRLKVTDAISAATEVEIPDIMVETELNRSHSSNQTSSAWGEDR